MNKKGLVAVQMAFLGVAFSMFVAGLILTPQHRINRANQKCVALGGEVTSCKDQVASMTPDEVLNYIKDTIESPSSAWME